MAAAAALVCWSPAGTGGKQQYLWAEGVSGNDPLQMSPKPHQQVFMLTLTVLTGGVQQLEGQHPVVGLVVEERSVSVCVDMPSIADNFVDIDCPIL